MAKVHVRKGDSVLVISGKDAGTQGKVLVVLPAKSKVVVEKINVVKRHTRPSRTMPQGGILEKEAPISSSKVMLVCNHCKQPTRTGRKILSDGKKGRLCKKCQELIG
ncbi:50S ribosomal protein L24 [Peptococcaceae bacterium SCADC1_2_3]|jgi:large subunit ribosomal protein L24|nr:50S ribosomal protein L24 [Peptococcaceae bacterium SCADC1_2_3]KFI35030.1 50S ribosomal protein L24 [Peptococcaceae bacterium SCADC1_2_3]KFI37759.1 50S ribosomal protein L24 [Peptococcaceae bacterium SCADC1_2_3]HBQ27981.1 50S ribosomal protein L24 [Desulfotomaculum sp.]HCJ79603.1 50S ribosomal protein L24 [Desulfotomaculum sp.]